MSSSFLTFAFLAESMALMVQSLVLLLQPSVFFYGARDVVPPPANGMYTNLLEMTKWTVAGALFLVGSLVYLISESRDNELKYYAGISMLVWNAGYLALELYMGIWSSAKMLLVKSVLMAGVYAVLLFIFPDKKNILKKKK